MSESSDTGMVSRRSGILRTPIPDAVSSRSLAYLGDGVGLVTVGDLGRLGAVGGESRDDLGDVGHVLAGVDASGGSENSSDGELHFDGCFCWDFPVMEELYSGIARARKKSGSDRKKKRVKLT